MNIQINIQLFARLRELAADNTLQLEIPTQGCTVGELMGELKQHPQLGETARNTTVLTAVNQTMVRSADWGAQVTRSRCSPVAGG